MTSAWVFRALCCGALAAAGCAKANDPPALETTYADSVVLEDSEPVPGSGFLDPNLTTAAALNALPGRATRLWLPLDINTVSSDEIMLIPGVDTRLRHELEEYRPYDGVEEFRRDVGEQIGPEEAARLERYIILP